MLFGNFVVAFLVVVIALSLISLIPAANTGGFLEGSPNPSGAIALIIISLIIIAAIKIPKKHYNPAPSSINS